MNRTIAFDNKKGVWKTRYSFFSSCIAWVKDLMVTAPMGTQENSLLWRHDGLTETNNSFYNVTTPSSIGVSFNDNPSANKQFKALSIESANPNNIMGLNTFMVNGESGTIGSIRQKGGILYGHIGTEDGYTVSNFEFIGVIRAIYTSVEDLEAATEVDMGDLSSANFIEFDYVEMNALSSGAAGITSNPQGVKDGTEAPLALGGGTIMYNGILLAGNVGDLSAGDSLFFAYPSNIVNGESPKGQVADVTLTLGSDDFEVHAVNLEYSPTNLDHSN